MEVELGESQFGMEFTDVKILQSKYLPVQLEFSAGR